jgi:hypothetical protein
MVLGQMTWMSNEQSRTVLTRVAMVRVALYLFIGELADHNP